MKNRQQILEPGMYYHVYNRAHGDERLFRVSENYRFFIQKYLRYVSPVADTYCYCLMPNHFHLLIRCKEEEDLMNFIEEERTRAGAAAKQQTQTLSGFVGYPATLTGVQDNLRRQPPLSKLITLQFSHLFNSYTQAYNKMYYRMGGLFMRPFNRIMVSDMSYLQTLVPYIHRNPVEAGLCTAAEDWPYSSYKNITESTPSFLKTSEVLEWFGTADAYVSVHKKT